MKNTPKGNRMHIALFGKVNSGKSSLLNALCKQDISIVSKQEGTTTDPVYKTMEIHGVGPVVWIDTAGWNDTSDLGEKRFEKSEEVLKQCDLALVLIHEKDEILKEQVEKIKKQNCPVLYLLTKSDICENKEELINYIQNVCEDTPICISSKTKEGFEQLLNEIKKRKPIFEKSSITGNLCSEKDVVLLVMPQDKQAPQGRLILPQAQTIRELLDKKCIGITTTLETFSDTLSILNKEPDLIICDSQVFKEVYKLKPKNSKLTSFSVLYANYKGDLKVYLEGVKAIATLNENSRVLIAEACTHAPLEEDIGRVKIPAMLRKRAGDKLQVDVVSGNDFPKDLSGYDLIIHCGACMFNRAYVLNRIYSAMEANVPITNYGITAAYLSGILEDVVFPGE